MWFDSGGTLHDTGNNKGPLVDNAGKKIKCLDTNQKV
jgi:hypothetical protein